MVFADEGAMFASVRYEQLLGSVKCHGVANPVS